MRDGRSLFMIMLLSMLTLTVPKIDFLAIIAGKEPDGALRRRPFRGGHWMVYLPRDLTRIESKYSLVVAVAKRARQIVSRKEPSLSEGRKPVTIALEEIV